jgi:hypothetical protein
MNDEDDADDDLVCRNCGASFDDLEEKEEHSGSA